MNPTIRRSSQNVHTQTAPKQVRKRRDTTPVIPLNQSAKVPDSLRSDADARKLNPQAEADTFRDKRLLKDLQDNANRSDLTKHRREISATNEDKDDEDEDEDEFEGLSQSDQEPETSDGEISETRGIVDR